MKSVAHLRRWLTGCLAILLLAACGRIAAPTRRPLPLKPDVPGTCAPTTASSSRTAPTRWSASTRLSATGCATSRMERGGEWEELPADLVDWDATRKWERDHATQRGGRLAVP